MNTLSIVIPCYNEEATLCKSVKRVLDIKQPGLAIEIVIVDDCSSDKSVEIATDLEREFDEVSLVRHAENQGKGAALRTGFQSVTGDFVAVQDADLEYDPKDLLRLIEPLIDGTADVVYGSRFLSHGTHRVLYFWHSMGNKFLTFMSNMLTDLNLTDMETCYKVFRRDVIQNIEITENRFGFEPEVTAKIAHKRLRVYEIGISYFGRTYEEGKKIGWRDGVRALYCIFHYNAHHAPMPVQFMIYLFIGAVAAVANLVIFLIFLQYDSPIELAAPAAFVIAALLNYYLCIKLLFRKNAQWNNLGEMFTYSLVVLTVAGVDLAITKYALVIGFSVITAKLLATFIGLLLNFLGRKYFVFKEASSGPWRPTTGSDV